MAMEYNEAEKRALEMMKRTDFKNLSKRDALSMASQLNQLRPDVAKEIIAQFPEFTKLVHSSLEEYKDILGNIIASDDASVEHVYSVAEKELDDSIESRNQYYEYARMLHADISKMLEKPDLPAEERRELLDRQMEIFNRIDEKDKEVRNQQENILSTVGKKDSEKRQFSWGGLKVATGALLVCLGAAVTVLGGDIKLKLPKK